MDRYEYKIREEEIQKLIDKRQLDDAIAIADTVDWRKETSVKMLFKISGLYAACKRCQESKEILLMALNRYPENRRIVFALCELSLKLNEIVQAQEYYRDFSRIAPTDPDRYILKYKIFQTLDVGLEERPELLEQFKQEDYRPKWGYELAELYHEMGMGSKCVDECEELIVTFGEGKYVIKAMQLKAQHESLTESEQARYEDYIAEQDREIMEISEEEDEKAEEAEETEEALANSELADEDLKDAPTAELPGSDKSDTDEIQVRPVDVGQYNTVNLQAALAESMKDLWDETDSEGEGEVDPDTIVPSTPEPGIEDNTLFVQEPLAGAEYAHPLYASAASPAASAQSVAQYDQAGYGDVQTGQAPQYGQQYAQQYAQSAGYGGQYGGQYGQPAGYPGAQAGYDSQYGQSAGHADMQADHEPESVRSYAQPEAEPGAEGHAVVGPKIDYVLKPEAPKEASRTEILLEQTKRIPTDTIVDYLETQKIRQEMQVSAASMQRQDAQSQKIPGAITGQLDVAPVVSSRYDSMLAEEYNGQIRLALTEAEKVEKQITGQLSIDDVLADWETTKKENEKKREHEVRQRILQHTGSLFDEFDEDTKAMLIEQLEKAFRDAILKDSDGKLDDEALGRKIRKEARRTMEYMTADMIIGEGVSKAMDDEADDSEAAIKTVKPARSSSKSPKAARAVVQESVDEPKGTEDDADETAALRGAESEAGFTDEPGFDAEAETEAESAIEAEAADGSMDMDEETEAQPEEDEETEADSSDAAAEALSKTARAAASKAANKAAQEAAEADESYADEEAGENRKSNKKPAKPVTKKKPASEDTDNIAVSAVEEALEEEARSTRGKKKKPAVQPKSNHVDAEGKRILSEEEEELFGGFLNRKGARKQIANALDKMSMAAYTGNCIVTGEEGVGTIELAKRLMRFMQITDPNFVADKVARVHGKNLNDKNLADLFSQLDGGAIIIQSARGMKKSTVQKLITAMENENLGILAILEDTSAGMDKIVGTLPKLGEIFNVRIDLQALDDKALVNYACEYAVSKEHSIDEFALLALHTRIGELQTNAHQVTVAEVRDLVDDAIFYADKKNPAHLFDIILHKRYDDEDMVVLREKDFMHY